MTTKIPEALDVLDRIIDYIDPDGHTYHFSEVEQVRKARAAFAALYEASERANGDHSSPNDCYATGPLTGNPIADLIACPGCALANALAAVEVLPK